MKVELDETVCWNETCEYFSTKHLSRCKQDSVGKCECQFDVSFKSDSERPKGECPWGVQRDTK